MVGLLVVDAGQAVVHWIQALLATPELKPRGCTTSVIGSSVQVIVPLYFHLRIVHPPTWSTAGVTPLFVKFPAGKLRKPEVHHDFANGD